MPKPPADKLRRGSASRGVYHGASKRRVEDITEALPGTRVSPSTDLLYDRGVRHWDNWLYH
jgi:hypothetical protein